MLDMKWVRNEGERVRTALKNRGADATNLDRFMDLDEKRRQLIQETESLKNKRNVVSQEIARLKKEKQDANDLIGEMKQVSQRIKDIDEELRKVEEELQQWMLGIPNLPHESVPVGESEADNVEIRREGTLPNFDFEAKAHWDLAADLDLLDFETAGKVTGSRFVFYKGIGARLERALVNFMLDTHIEEHGYTEIFPPYIVNRDSMTGTGQLPKFEEDAFQLSGTDYFLIPTAEVPGHEYASGRDFGTGSGAEALRSVQQLFSFRSGFRGKGYAGIDPAAPV